MVLSDPLLAVVIPRISVVLSSKVLSGPFLYIINGSLRALVILSDLFVSIIHRSRFLTILSDPLFIPNYVVSGPFLSITNRSLGSWGIFLDPFLFIADRILRNKIDL